MKKTIAGAILSSILLMSSNGYAESTAPLNQDIQGTWVLEFTKRSEKSEEKFEREDTWTFNNGKVIISHIPRDGGYYDQLPVNYEIADNKLKIAILGRSGRFDKFTLINNDQKNMTLKAVYGDIYQFVKK